MTDPNLSKSVAVKPSRCPSCGWILDRVSEFQHEGATPSPGDCTVCYRCECILVWDDDMNVQLTSLQSFTKEQRSTVERALNYLKAHKSNGIPPGVS